MPNTSLLQSVDKFLTTKVGQSDYVYHQVVSGGDINQAFKIVTSAGSYFVKYNSSPNALDMLEKEALGLALLDSAQAIQTPKVVGTGFSGQYAFLVLEFVEKQEYGKDFMAEFGHKLALLHQKSDSSFGLSHSNFIGSLVQNNQQHTTWEAFFINERLVPQLKMARDCGKLPKKVITWFDALFARLADIFPNESPALLHGDLWAGNYLCGRNQTPYLIDPAVYYGHREMDIAMTQLFGGFPNSFYEGYQRVFPLEKAWKSRIEIANLYPLLVHVNLFGGGYVDTVDKIVRKFA